MGERKSITGSQMIVLAISMLTAFMSTFTGSALNLAIPDMSAYFNMGAASVGWITTSYMLMIAAFSVPFGKLADGTGRRRMLLLGILIFSVTSFASVFAVSSYMIITARAVQGLGAAMIFATNMPIAISMFPGKERGRAIGLVTSGTYIGLAMGPVIGGIMNSHLGWKSIFAAVAVIGAVAFVLTVFGVDKKENLSGMDGFDIPGNIVYIIMLMLLIYGFTVLNSSKTGWLFLACGLAVGVLFVIIEKRSAHPVIDISMFTQDRVFTLSNITALFNYSATFALGYLVAIYLQVAHGLSSQTAGFIMISQPLLMAILSPRMGRLSDRIPAYKLASAGMGLCALALLFFTFIKADTPIILIVLDLALAGTGIALFSSPNTNVVMSRVPPTKFGLTNSILSTMRTTGQSSGMAIITIVVSATVGDISLYDVSPEGLTKTMHLGFGIFTVLCLIGIFMSLQRSKGSNAPEDCSDRK